MHLQIVDAKPSPTIDETTAENERRDAEALKALDMAALWAPEADRQWIREARAHIEQRLQHLQKLQGDALPRAVDGSFRSPRDVSAT